MKMTPNDILNKRFEKGMGGYKTEDVHQFLNQVADYVGELERERTDLQHKLEILADKLEEYKEDEDSLRAALIGAQKLGDSVVRESKRKAEAVIADAVRKAEKIAVDAQRRIDAEAFELEKMRTEVASFKANLMKLYRSHLKLIEALPDDEAAIEVPRISYTPPVEVIQQASAPAAQDNGGENVEEMVMAAAVMNKREEAAAGFTERLAEPATEVIQGEAAGESEPVKRTTRLRYDKLNQFFGEDNPVERE